MILKTIFIYDQIVETRPMNHQNIVNQKVGPASVIYLHVTMAIVFHEFIFVMVIMVSINKNTK